MADLLIRDLDPETHTELKARADRAGRSLQGYVAGVLRTHARSVPVHEWLSELDELEPLPDVHGSDLLRATRDELP